MTTDYTYEKAPLIEVIAEIHWTLKKLDTAPDARIDPYYDLFRDQFLSYVKDDKNIKLSHVEELVPNIVPLELLPNQPRLRLRSHPGKWPLAQLGPGVITANIVPPYEGWEAFRPFIHKLVDGLFKHYPIAEKTLRIEKLHLRYIDGFDKSFGLEQYSDFATKMLGIKPIHSNDFIDHNVKEGTEVKYLIESYFSNLSPDGSYGKIKLTPGKMNNIDALIMELHCESGFPDHSAPESEFVKAWFDEAHHRLHQQFEGLATDALRTVMGCKKEVSQ